MTLSPAPSKADGSKPEIVTLSPAPSKADGSKPEIVTLSPAPSKADGSRTEIVILDPAPSKANGSTPNISIRSLEELLAEKRKRKEMAAEMAAEKASRTSAAARGTSQHPTQALAIAPTSATATAAGPPPPPAPNRGVPWQWDAGLGQYRLPVNTFGAIFGATNETIGECLQRGLFGLPGSRADFVAEVGRRRGSTLLFLFNFSTRQLHGIYTATGPAGFPLHPRAWVPGCWSSSLGAEIDDLTSKRTRPTITPFMAQLPVAELGPARSPLPEAIYGQAMRYEGRSRKFAFSLDAKQTLLLVNLFITGTKASQ